MIVEKIKRREFILCSTARSKHLQGILSTDKLICSKCKKLICSWRLLMNVKTRELICQSCYVDSKILTTNWCGFTTYNLKYTPEYFKKTSGLFALKVLDGGFNLKNQFLGDMLEIGIKIQREYGTIHQKIFTERYQTYSNRSNRSNRSTDRMAMNFTIGLFILKGINRGWLIAIDQKRFIVIEQKALEYLEGR